jgi:hypothetical protein
MDGPVGRNSCKILDPYRKCVGAVQPRWPQVCPAEALAIGRFGRSRWRLRRTRSSYGFCMDDSRFVRLSGRRSAGVSRMSERCGRDLGPVGGRFCPKISIGMEWEGSREDTTAVGAQARAADSVMVRWLGRVKEWTPDSKLPSSKYRKSFDDDHGSGTFWTAETSGLGG